MPTTRTRVSRHSGGGAITPRAVELYREGVACTGQARRFERYELSRQLHQALGVSVLLPCLLEDRPEFLLAVQDETPYRLQWHEIKSQLEEARNAAMDS